MPDTSTPITLREESLIALGWGNHPTLMQYPHREDWKGCLLPLEGLLGINQVVADWRNPPQPAAIIIVKPRHGDAIRPQLQKKLVTELVAKVADFLVSDAIGLQFTDSRKDGIVWCIAVLLFECFHPEPAYFHKANITSHKDRARQLLRTHFKQYPRKPT